MFSEYQQFPGALPAGGTTLTLATELAYMISPANLELPEASQGVVIRGYLSITLGATGTGGTIKCRRGSGVAGAQVGNTQTFAVPAAAGNNPMIPFSFNDPIMNSPGLYTVTFTATGVAATAVDGALEICVPVPGGTDV
jgi:hypothetical protein